MSALVSPFSGKKQSSSGLCEGGVATYNSVLGLLGDGCASSNESVD